MTEEQNSFLAEKLIKRLESVGMRTSYREFYDIFLSKTTNERPIGMVFRRWKPGRGDAAAPAGGGGHRIADEFDWSTDFLQSLSIKCREHEFERKVPISGVTPHCEDAGDASGRDAADRKEGDPLRLPFMPLPNVDTTPKNGLVADYLTGVLGNLTLGYCDGAGPVMRCMGSEPPSSPPTTKKEGADDFLRNRTLCSLVEQSVGLIFLRWASAATPGGGKERKGSPKGSPRARSGSGFAVVRKAEGSWSAPCFLSLLGSKDRGSKDKSIGGSTSAGESNASDLLSSSMDAVKMIVIRKKELVNSLIQGNAVKFTARHDDRANVLVRDAAIICAQEGRFKLANDFLSSVRVNDAQNQGAYSLSTDHIEASDILVGEFILRCSSFPVEVKSGLNHLMQSPCLYL